MIGPMPADRHTRWEVSVVIPFFQRERGILRKAVVSALRQEGIPTPQVIVVDDGSPISADSEVRDLLEEHPRHLVVLRQENGGPGAARNTGIGYARNHARYIAFLDSDDSWEPAHLRTAKRALDGGFDLYFCDAVHRDGKRTVFETRPIPPEECRLVDAEHKLFAFTGDLFWRVLAGRPMQIPAVVYRVGAFPALFRTDLRMAQDHFMFMQVASGSPRTIFSTACNVRLGYGVNNYNSAEWGTPEMLRRIFYDQLCMMDAARQWGGAPRYRPMFRAVTQRHRRDFLNNIISASASARRGEVLPVARRYFKLDPLAVAVLPLALAGRVRTRLQR